MARLKEYNGHYCESEYEYAFIGFLEAEGWKYTSGNKLSRVTKRDVLIEDDFKKFIADGNLDLTEDEVTQIYDIIRLVGAESDFATLHKVYNWLVDGIQFTPKDGIARMIPLINFERDGVKNIFRVVNQFTVEYTNNGQKENRRPDVILFVNGMPLCIMELKNPADANATIYDAWEQINIRYWRDIPHLLHYCPLACISDGVKTRLGTVCTPYEHFYAWRRVNDGDAVSTLPFAETETMIKGVYSPERFLEIFRDYIYFQDSIYDSDEVEIVCRYPQFFAARLLKQSIVDSVVTKSGRGGTYFGATGCGKTYTMAFLARQLALRCTDISEIGSPTIILIVDRDELQKQGAKLFTKSTEFLNLGKVSVVKNRTQLRQELGARQSGGFYICTIQKFCDREDDKIGLINDRQNIICFSDEAHRTQLEHSKKIQFSKDADANMKAMVSKPYEIIDTFQEYKVSSYFQRELNIIGRKPEAVYDILFKETDFSIFTRDTVDFYEDALSGFLSAYVDGFRENGKRDDIEKKIRILETYVNNIPEDYVRNILEKRLFLCKGRYSRWDVNKVKAEYSYKDKCFLNAQIEKYGSNHLVDVLYTIYLLNINELLPEILVSISSCFTKAIRDDKEQFAKEIKDSQVIVDMIILKSFIFYSDEIKKYEKLINAYEDILLALTEIKNEKAAVLLDEFRIH